MEIIIETPEYYCVVYDAWIDPKLIYFSELMMKLLAVDSKNKQSKSLKDYNKYVSKVRLVRLTWGNITFICKYRLK